MSVKVVCGGKRKISLHKMLKDFSIVLDGIVSMGQRIIHTISLELSEVVQVVVVVLYQHAVYHLLLDQISVEVSVCLHL